MRNAFFRSPFRKTFRFDEDQNSFTIYAFLFFISIFTTIIRNRDIFFQINKCTSYFPHSLHSSQYEHCERSVTTRSVAFHVQFSNSLELFATIGFNLRLKFSFGGKKKKEKKEWKETLNFLAMFLEHIVQPEGLKRIHLRRDVSPGNLLRYSIKQPIVAGFVSDETPQRELPYSL